MDMIFFFDISPASVQHQFSVVRSLECLFWGDGHGYVPSKCCNCKVVQGSDLVTLLLGIATDLSPECLMQADWAKINLHISYK